MDPSEEAAAQNVASTTEENYFVTYTFTDPSHSSRVAQSIMKLCMEEHLFADVTILVEGKEFQLHRLVLSAQSCFFRSMLSSNLKEGLNRVIELQDVSASVFQLLVDYIYYGKVKLRMEELLETYEVADMYQLTALFEECSRFLARTVQVKNCLQNMWLADRHSDTSLYTAAKNCAKMQLSQLCETEDFVNLPVRFLTDILADGVPSSENPTNAIKNWIHFSKEEREGHSEMLLSSLKIIEDSNVEEYEQIASEHKEPEYESSSDHEGSVEYAEVDENFHRHQNNNDPDDPQQEPNEERPRSPDPWGLLQDTHWCGCGHCRIMPRVDECICCLGDRGSGRYLKSNVCITQHADFTKYIASRQFLIQLLHCATSMSDNKFKNNENRYLRLAAYRKYVAMRFGFIGLVRGIYIPSCVVTKIREMYPDPNGRYNGIKWYKGYTRRELPVYMNF